MAVRKPNEGVDDSQWKKLTPLVKDDKLDDLMFAGKVCFHYSIYLYILKWNEQWGEKDSLVMIFSIIFAEQQIGIRFEVLAAM